VKKDVSLYFHIPFCTKKCPYCHFYVIPNKLSHHTVLREALALEWERELPKLQEKTIISIYFGGGTPILFSGIGTVLEKISYTNACEITIEANPEDSSLDTFTHLRSLGVNRLSLGVQSLDDRSLQTLERIHSAEKAKQAIFLAERAGFKNISIDLMYDLPDQTEESFRYTLDQLGDLPIQHLSLYNLTVEPHTAFFKRQVKTPPQEQSLRLLSLALKKLDAIGLSRYEISAFARPDHESRHNLGYWTGRPFLGFGPSAFSYWEGKRFRNIANLSLYAKRLKEGQSPIDFIEELPYPANIKELLAIHLRVKTGVDLSQFLLPEETLVAIEKLKEAHLLSQEKQQLKLTEQGMLFYDTVAAELI
jgi:oxygen-independent coproporphyrinogen-3 oxidase